VHIPRFAEGVNCVTLATPEFGGKTQMSLQSSESLKSVDGLVLSMVIAPQVDVKALGTA
jgi:hypothetical protein